MSAASWTVWSWSAENSMWMEVTRGTKDEMTGTFGRKRQAAAKHLPSARFALCGPGETPHHVPDEDGAP